MPVVASSGNKVNSRMIETQQLAMVGVDDEVSEVMKLQCTISEVT